MKTILIPAAVLASLLLAGMAATIRADIHTMKDKTEKPDGRGHILNSKWAEYQAATDSDRPQRQAAVLEDIISEARRRNLPWDFFDASRKYVETVQSRNWKMRDSLANGFARSVKEFDNPLVTFEFRRTERNDSPGALTDLALAEKDRLLNGHNNAFYLFSDNYPVQHALSECLPGYLSNDWEYAMWTCILSSGKDLRKDKAFIELTGYLGQRYPLAAYLEYLAASDIPSFSGKGLEEKEQALRAVADKYEGKAMCIYPKMDLLNIEFNRMNSGHHSSDEYRTLLEKAESLERERKGFTGEEGKLVKDRLAAREMIERLNSKDIYIEVKGKTISLRVRNLPSAEVSIFSEGDKKPFYTVRVPNPKCSFFLMDTISTKLPALNDGTYEIHGKNGKVESETMFSQFRLSLAERREKRGTGIYVARYDSGKPLRTVDLAIMKKGSLVSSIKDFHLDEGFTLLPSSMQKTLDGGKGFREIVATTRDSAGLVMKSNSLGFSEYYEDEDSPLKTNRVCNIYLDRGAYNPGDTVHFKGILCEGDMRKSFHVSEGIVLEAVLNDSQGNRIQKMNLTTNGFGSVSGEFVLPAGLRNGEFSISLAGRDWRGYAGFRVDEFVLPTFDVQFDEVDHLYFPGDSVNVSGTVRSYSGHSLSGADVKWKVLRGNDLFDSGSLNPDSDGKFSFSFTTDPGSKRWAFYRISAIVTDRTGETHEFHKVVMVTSSLNVDIRLLDTRDGQATVRGNGTTSVIDGDTARLMVQVKNSDGQKVPAGITWSLMDKDGSVLKSAGCDSGETVKIDMKDLPSGFYKVGANTVAVDSRGNEFKGGRTISFVKLSGQDNVVDRPIESIFITGGTEIEPEGKMHIRMGSASGPVWAVVELFGDKRELLDSRTVYLKGKGGEPGSVSDIEYVYRNEWPDAVYFRIFYFKASSQKTFERQFRRHRRTLDLPLEFSSFEDRTLPATEYTFNIKTLPNTECLAAVFDKSVETIRANHWPTVRLADFSVPWVNVNSVPGSVGEQGRYVLFNERMTKSANTVLVASQARGMSVVEETMVSDEAVAEYDVAAAPDTEDIAIRENFAKTLTFQPFLNSGSDGNISLKFNTSDKLSTYIVALYAHDKGMRNASVRRETVVSLPVKVSVAEPGYVYSGDKYSLSASVSSNSDEAVHGKLVLYQYNGTDYRNSSPASVKSFDITVPAHGSVSRDFDVNIPGDIESRRETGLKVAFAADNFSDGVFVTLPVLPSVQTVTESHSAVVLPGTDKEALLAKVRRAFVNVSGNGAEYKEISILDMVLDAIPDKVEPKTDNIMDLSEAYYVRKIAGKLGTAVHSELTDSKLWEKILACRNEDGGFGWFEGMASSPVITAVLLERFSKLSKGGLLPEINLGPAIKFLDQCQFDATRPYWCGGISDAQYMYVRSLYPDIAFDVKPKFFIDGFNKKIKEFKKDAKEYLTPGKVRGMNGQILPKARRLTTLRNLLSSREGIALAKSWGVTIGTGSRLEKSLEADVLSLVEYAVDHPDGGIYYPNAVMPYRGLLESEAYAHSMLCDLLNPYRAGISDGIRTWLMLQKETQKWGSDPAFVDAINSVLEGSEEVKATQVIVMTQSYEKPFREILPAGNGFTIERKLFRTDGEKTVELKAGDIVVKGEKLRAEYRIWNQENRSFVKVTVPREAGLMPADQLSGHYGLGIRPLHVNGWYSFVPGGYRNVKEALTEYYFDSYPEEKTVIREDFFATRTGIWTAPAVTVESLYATHYRANGGFGGPLEIE